VSNSPSLSDAPEAPMPLLAIRAIVGGVLMGLANLVPGISGGTMLLATGVYPLFINGIAELTTLKFKLRSIVVVGCVAAAALLGILLLAGTIKELVIDHRWVMYSLFIGLTLGGVPIVWGMIGKPSRSCWVGVVFGFLGMAALAWVQQSGSGAQGGDDASWVMLLLAGVAGASAMILPGVSGGYLLLVMGVYVPILSGVDTLKEGLKAADMTVVMEVGIGLVLPVGLGVVVGVVGVSNVLRLMLRRYEKATLGVLLGLLLGAVVGLWPFQKGIAPEAGDVVKGQVVTVETLAEIDPEDYPTRRFSPTGGQWGGALALILFGFGVTYAISRFGGAGETKTEDA
jgi:putative membrane protein